MYKNLKRYISLKRIVLICAVLLTGTFLISEAEATTNIVLVPPFQNLSTSKSMISYEVATNTDPDRPTRSFTVDRYSEAPRGILEDILVGIPGVTIVERQRVDALLVESEFGHFSGLVDTQQAVQMGKMLGATTVIMGSILDIRAKNANFSGYGVETDSTEVISSIRIHLIDIASGRVTYSKIVKGSVSYFSSRFGGTTDSDVAFAVIESSLEQLREDEGFKQAFGDGRNEDSSSGVIVKFYPQPDNCDIDIGGTYMGGSPIEIPLSAGKSVQVRISKAGYQTWEKTIIPREGLIVKPELLLIGRLPKNDNQ